MVQDLYEPIRSYLAQLKERGKCPWCESRKGYAFVCYEQGHVRNLKLQSEVYSGLCCKLLVLAREEMREASGDV